MSLAAFKAKSLTMYGNHSTKDGFSLNGPLRQPSLGENLGRSVTRTPFRGPAPMGHGMGSRCRVGGWRARTCGGTYPISIHRSCLGTPQTLVKRSTMNEKGLIETVRTPIHTCSRQRRKNILIRLYVKYWHVPFNRMTILKGHKRIKK